MPSGDIGEARGRGESVSTFKGGGGHTLGGGNTGDEVIYCCGEK